MGMVAADAIVRARRHNHVVSQALSLGIGMPQVSDLQRLTILELIELARK
jgi:hypothetical protein